MLRARVKSASVVVAQLEAQLQGVELTFQTKVSRVPQVLKVKHLEEIWGKKDIFLVFYQLRGILNPVSVVLEGINDIGELVFIAINFD